MIDMLNPLVKVEYQFMIFFSCRTSFEGVFRFTTLVLSIFFNMLHKEVVTYSTTFIIIF